MSSLEKFPLNFEQITSFLQVTWGKSDVYNIATTFTSDINSLIEMLSDIYSLLNDRSLKSRITRIKKRLENPTITESSEESTFEDL